MEMVAEGRLIVQHAYINIRGIIQRIFSAPLSHLVDRAKLQNKRELLTITRDEIELLFTLTVALRGRKITLHRVMHDESRPPLQRRIRLRLTRGHQFRGETIRRCRLFFPRPLLLFPRHTDTSEGARINKHAEQPKKSRPPSSCITTFFSLLYNIYSRACVYTRSVMRAGG